MTSAFLAASPGMKVLSFGDRGASPDDLASLRALYESGEMRGDGLSLRYDRGADFFRFLDWQADDGLLLYYRVPPEPVRAIGSITFRHAWVNGSLARISYLQDLRTDSGRLVTRTWRRCVADFVRTHSAPGAAPRMPYHLAAVFRGNAVGLKTMSKGLGAGVSADVVANYDIVQILGRWRSAKAPEKFAVRAARREEESKLIALLDASEHDKAFGFAFAAEEWARRRARWPGFDIEKFRIVEGADGHLLACALPWSPAAGKQVIVQKLPRGLRIARKAINASTRWHGLALPRDGEALRALYITHFAIHPDVATPDRLLLFRSLITSIYNDEIMAHPGKWSSLSFAECEGSERWGSALRGYFLQRTPAVLLALHGPETPPAPKAGAAGVGIELAII